MLSRSIYAARFETYCVVVSVCAVSADHQFTFLIVVAAVNLVAVKYADLSPFMVRGLRLCCATHFMCGKWDMAF